MILYVWFKIAIKKYLVVFVVVCITITVKAQLWCTPNSVWHYDTSNPTWNTTYTKQTYLYDTIVLGVTFNKIKSETHGYGMSGPINNYSYLYTSLQNDVVFFNSTNSNIAAIDTLMYFGPIGAKWRCWKSGGVSCNQSFIEIVDTGTTVIQSQALKWRKINYTNYYLYGTANQTVITGVDTLFERIGYKHLAFQFLGYCSDVVDVSESEFRCFQDGQINVNATSKVCDYVTGLQENLSEKKSILIYPNPSNNILNLKFSNEDYNNLINIEIIDNLGRKFLLDKTVSLNISKLNSGFYGIKFYFKNKEIIVKSFIKN